MKLQMKDKKVIPSDLTRTGLHVVPFTISIPAYGVGIDPGVNFGVSVFSGRKGVAIYGALLKTKTTGKYAEYAYDIIHHMMLGHTKCRAIIEGAAFNKSFGQPLLESIRTGFALGMRNIGWEYEIMPPISIRKRAFGDIKIRADEVWPTLNHNAADSLAMAYVSAGKDVENA